MKPASRSAKNEEQQITTGESKEQESLLPPLRQSLFLLLLRARIGPIRRRWVADHTDR